jgi:hypothetical protein
MVAYRYHDGTTKWTAQKASDNRVLVLEPHGAANQSRVLMLKVAALLDEE